MSLLIAVLIVFTLLVIAELWWRTLTVHDEFSRKFVHITVGSFVAFWPYFLSWNQIRLLSVAFLVVVALSLRLGIFSAIHSVQRATWGEVIFALAVGALTFVTQNKEIYTTALLQMSLADGLAAVVGLRYGAGHRYLVFGHPKSIAGTATFFVTSVIILLGYVYLGYGSLGMLPLVGIAVLASVLENIAVQGLDNIVVPAAVGLLLTHLS